MDAPASKRQRMGDICTEEEITLSVNWKSLEVPYTISRYEIEYKLIKDVSFSSTSPDVLYILGYDGRISSFCVSTQTLTEMVISGLQSRGHIYNLLCYNKFLYIAQWDGNNYALHKCIIEKNSSLRAIGSYIGTALLPMLHAAIKGRHLYCIRTVGDDDAVDVIDSDKMALLSTRPLEHIVYDIAVSEDDKLHVATEGGVHIYTTDGTCTGQSYLAGEKCKSITCTSNKYSIVGMKYKAAVVASDLSHIYYISTASMPYYRVMYSTVDNSLVMWCSNYLLIPVPQQVYQPPFSLFSLCMSTILLGVDEIPISLLPTRIHKLVERYTKH